MISRLDRKGRRSCGITALPNNAWSVVSRRSVSPRSRSLHYAGSMRCPFVRSHDIQQRDGKHKAQAGFGADRLIWMSRLSLDEVGIRTSVLPRSMEDAG